MPTSYDVIVRIMFLPMRRIVRITAIRVLPSMLQTCVSSGCHNVT